MLLKVNIPYLGEYDKEKLEEGTTNVDLTANYLISAVELSHRDGITPSDRRMFARIQNKLDEVLYKKADELDLEQAELDFLLDAFSKASFPPKLCKYVVLLENQLKSLSDIPQLPLAK